MLYSTIRDRRLAANPKISCREIAERAGVDVGTVRVIEIGKVQNPGILTITRIMGALDQIEAQRAAQSPTATTP